MRSIRCAMVVIAACSGRSVTFTSEPDGGTPATAADATPVPGDVHGTVLDGVGTPIANAKVRLGGTDAVITTGADGGFAFADAPGVYELDVVGAGWARSYRGFVTRAPTVRVPGVQMTAPLQYTLTGTSLAANEHVEVMFVAAATISGYEGGPSATENVTWLGGTTAPGVLTTFVIGRDAQGNPTSLRGMPAASSVTLQANTAATIDFTYADAPGSAITGQWADAGTPTSGIITYHRPDLPALGAEYLSWSMSSNAVSALTIADNNSTYDVAIEVQTAPKEYVMPVIRGLAADASGLTFEWTTTPVHVVAPADGSTGVAADAQIQWNHQPGVVYVAMFCDQSDPIGIITTADSATLPDLSALGVTLPSGKSCSLQLLSYSTIPTLEEYTEHPETHALLTSSSFSSAVSEFTTL